MGSSETLDSEDSQLSVLLVGSDGLAQELEQEIQVLGEFCFSDWHSFMSKQIKTNCSYWQHLRDRRGRLESFVSILVTGHAPTHPCSEASPDPNSTLTLDLTQGRVGTCPATEQGPKFLSPLLPQKGVELLAWS